MDIKQIDYNITYPADLSADKVTSIDVTTPPTKTAYIEGQAFDPSGMVVTATYADDTTAVIADYSYAPTGQLAITDTAITVSYTDPFDATVYTDTQPITVAAKIINSISATFAQGETAIFTSNTLDSLKQYLTVTAAFNDSTSGPLDPSRYTLSGDLVGDTLSGPRTITVTAGESKTTTFVVNVTKVEQSTIDAVFTQGASVFYTSSPLDSLKSNLVVTGVNNDASTFPIAAGDYTLSGTMSAGQSTITATHTASGKTDTFTVNVTPVVVDNLVLSGVLAKTTYNAYDEFDRTGLVVTANYNDGSSADVTSQVYYYYSNGFGSFFAGDTWIDIVYDGIPVRQLGLTVNKLPISKPAVTGVLTYNGSAQSPTITVDGAYTISGNSQTNAGNYFAAVALNDKLNYEWTDKTDTDLSLAWSIGQKALAADAIAAIENQTYTGSALEPALTVMDGSVALALNTDYTAAYSANTAAGTASVTITGIGNYSGTATQTFVINKADYDMSGIGFAPASKVYNGAPQSIAITGTLPTGADLIPVTVSYSGSATNVADSGAIITATFATTSLNYNAPAPRTAALTITPKPLAAGAIVPIAAQTYTGSPLTPPLTVMDGSVALVLNMDYTAAYSANTAAGTASVTITGIGNYGGTDSENFTITPKALPDGAIGVIADQTYTGSPLTPLLTVKDGSVALVLNTDYTAAYSNNTDAGTATVTISGIGNYGGTDSEDFTILPKSIAGASFTVDAQTYNGSPLTPVYTVKDGEKTLIANTDYTFTNYANNTVVGTGDINIAGIGNYTGTAIGHFAINKADYDMTGIGFVNASKEYNGAAQSIEITGILPQGADGIAVTVSHIGSATNVSDGAKTITATFATTSLNYNTPVPKTAALTITPKPLAADAIGAIADQTYTGSDLTPALTVAGVTSPLVLNTDYTAAYSSNRSAGTGSVTITGIGNYSGTATQTFVINKANYNMSLVLFQNASKEYNGQAQIIEVMGALPTGADGRQVTVSYTGSATNVSDGAKTITATFATTSSNYNVPAPMTADLTITPKPLADGAIGAIVAQTYTGIAQTPVLTVMDGSTALVLDTDYTAVYSNNINAGNASVTITGIGNYTGTDSENFTITPKALPDGAIGVIADQTYTGSPLTPLLTVKDGSVALVLNTDYTAAYSNNTDAGTATVTISGIGNYSGAALQTFVISKADYDMTGIGFADATKVYNGTAQSLLITGALPVGADLIPVTVSYTGSATNVADSPATITATFATASPNYNTPAPLTAVLTLNKADHDMSGIGFAPASKVYNYMPQIIEITGVLPTGLDSGQVTVSYTGSATNVADSGAIITATFAPNSENYNTPAPRTAALTITPLPLRDGFIGPIADLPYTGLAQTPLLTVTDHEANDAGLTLNADYTAAYSSNLNAGVATATITGIGNYTGTDSENFNITPAGYTVAVAAAKDVKRGSTMAALPAAATTGVNSETPAGTLLWYTDANRTIALTDGTLSAYNLGAKTLYWEFTSTNGNYTPVPKTGQTVVTIVEGDPQNITITGIPAINPIYGDVAPIALGTVVRTVGDVIISDGGAITWLSNNPAVASVDANTGVVTILTRGTTTITATAAAKPGIYAQGTASFVLTVDPKVLTVLPGTYKVSKTYDGTLVKGTASGDLALTGALAADTGKIGVAATVPAYTNKNVGGQATMNVTLAMTGTAVNNYTLATGTLAVPCEILQKEITAVAVASVTKTYDGTIGPGNASTGTVTLTGKVGTDVLTIGLTVGAFSDANVATAGKTAAVNLGALSDAVNYKLAASVVSPINVPATITKATITGIATAAPTATILANDAKNTDAANLKAAAIVLPANVTVNFAGGTESLPITWANATPAFNAKGAAYIYKGTVAVTPNFNAYATTLDATLTVTPVLLTSVTGVPASSTQAKATVTGAAAMTDIGFPATVTLNFDNAVPPLVVNATWNKTLAELQTLAGTVTAAADKSQAVSLTSTNIPIWATVSVPLPSVNLLITSKFVIPTADITFPAIAATFGDALIPAATVDLATYPGTAATYSYIGTGSTIYGPSATAPVNAGTYAVTATIENATHKGTADAALTINPKAIAAIVISAIPDQTYTGAALAPAYTVTGDTVPLTAGTDYTGAFTANTNAGVATLTVTAKGNYSGTQTATFNITKATPTITFANTSQRLTSAGGNITDVTATLSPASAGAAVALHYWVVVTPGADPTLDVYGWSAVVPQTAGTYKIYGSTPGDANLNAINAVAPDAATVTQTLVVSPYSAGGGTVVTPPPVVQPPVTTGTTTTVTTTVPPTTTGTTSTAQVSNTSFTTTVNSALTTSQNTQTTPSVVVSVQAPATSNRVEVTLPTAPVTALVAGDAAANLTVASPVASVTFDGTALQAITGQAQGNTITVVAVDVQKETLTTAQQDLVGDRPVLDLAVMSGGQIISDFKGGVATVSVPYTPSADELHEGIIIWFLGDDGQLTQVPCTFDAATGTVTFTSGHFSQYVLAYFPFTDMNDSQWHYENVAYAYTNGLMNGTSTTLFSPANTTTRGMVVTILWRMAGQPAAAKHAFSDVKAAWYDQAISWASENGIVSGYGNGLFGPEDAITREQMAKILYNYGVYKSYSMEGRGDIAAFADAGKVSAWAADPLRWAVANNIIGGTGAGRLDPTGGAQRAQVAAILQRFLQGVAQ